MKAKIRRTSVLCLIAVLSISTEVIAQDTSKRLVSASGKAEIKVVPDEVRLILGVETFDPELIQAKKENDESVAKILAAAKRHGVEPQHLQTDYLSIDPTVEYRSGSKRQDNYVVRRTLVVTMRDIDRFEDLLAAALESGANHVHGIDFRTTELRRHRDEARRLAVRAAKEKADLLANELGATLGDVHSISEQAESWWSMYGSWWGTRWNSMSQNVVQNAGGSAASDSATAPGQISVSAEVRVQFELR